jgi:Mu-like prophage I protein
MSLRALLPVFQLNNQFEGTEEAPSSWVQCGKIGNFFSKRYKKFEITEQTLQELASNFDGEIVADYDHYSTLPLEKRPAPDAGVAAGWVKKVEQRGNTFWAFVEWTKKAAQQIREKQFRYISPTYDPVAVSSEGEPRPIGAKLLAIALTNQPFLTGMQAVSLSAATGSELVELAEISLDDKRFRIAQAFYNKYSGEFETPYIEPSGIYDDYLICRRSGKLWKISFTTDENFESFEFGEPVEVVPSFTELSQGDTMSAAATGQPQQETVQPIQPQPDQATLSRVAALENENRELKKRLDRSEAEKRVDTLVRQGKIIKAQRDWAVGYCLSDAAGFTAYEATLKPLVELGVEHGSGGDPDPEEVERVSKTPTAKLQKIVDDFTERVISLSATKNIKTSEALRLTQEQDPEAAEQYLEAFQELSALSGSE